MELQGLKKRREMVLQERDNIIKNRSLLELKHMRMENSTDRRLAELEGQMRALKQESSTLKPSAQQGDTEAARKLIISHNQLKALEKSRKSLLVSKPQDSEMELSALDDRVDILSAELEYLNDAIAERLRMVSSASLAAEGIQCCVACLSSEEAHGVLEHCLMQLVQVLQEQKHKADKIARLEAAVVDKTHQVDVAESNLKVKHKELERRLREVQREHAVKVQGLLRQIKVLSREQPLPLPGRVDGSASGRGNGGEASPGMSSCTDAEQEAAFYKQQAEQLSKDNFYYKLRNKELKQKLKGMQAEGSSGDQASTQADAAAGKRPDAKVMTSDPSFDVELDHYKAHLRKVGTVVRLSKSQLLPLSNGQVDMVKASARRRHARSSTNVSNNPHLALC
ncbi:unnamed protein product [Ostreobium quekettii]|uniref:Uncharacterized protein n=1 Tax=Ostreobium quekettii TaxID=121088 RepID=A0A8S1JBD8_9CHLO|nr:unnamed protein product [Ostreobium quekettii]